MASAAKIYVTEHGEDPAQYTLVAFGGAGPVHAAALAEELDGNPEQLLLLLRDLERLHRDLQDGPFRQSLPEDRQKLFTLLQGMERNGGWPYIPRLQLRTFIDLLGQDALDAAA